MPLRVPWVARAVGLGHAEQAGSGCVGQEAGDLSSYNTTPTLPPTRRSPTLHLGLDTGGDAGGAGVAVPQLLYHVRAGIRKRTPRLPIVGKAQHP